MRRTRVEVADGDHSRAFLDRHQDKLMFGSDCSDSFGGGVRCGCSQTIAALKRLAPSSDVPEKIFRRNAEHVMRI